VKIEQHPQAKCNPIVQFNRPSVYSCRSALKRCESKKTQRRKVPRRPFKLIAEPRGKDSTRIHPFRHIKRRKCVLSLPDYPRRGVTSDSGRRYGNLHSEEISLDLSIDQNDIFTFDLRMVGSSPTRKNMKPTILIICNETRKELRLRVSFIRIVKQTVPKRGCASKFVRATGPPLQSFIWPGGSWPSYDSPWDVPISNSALVPTRQWWDQWLHILVPGAHDGFGRFLQAPTIGALFSVGNWPVCPHNGTPSDWWSLVLPEWDPEVEHCGKLTI